MMQNDSPSSHSEVAVQVTVPDMLVVVPMHVPDNSSFGTVLSISAAEFLALRLQAPSILFLLGRHLSSSRSARVPMIAQSHGDAGSSPSHHLAIAWKFLTS